MLLVMAVSISLLLRRSSRYFGKRKREKHDPVVRIPRPSSGRWSTNIDSPEQVAKFEVQLQETMREISAQLDNKMVALQILIKQANEKIAQMETLQRAIHLENAEVDPAAAAAIPESLKKETEAIDPALQQIYVMADQGFSAVTIAHRVARPLSEIESLLRERAKL